MTKVFKADELSNSDYHAIPGISGSGLKTIYDTSVEHYLSANVTETEAMRIGTIIHTAILEPEVFDRTYFQGFDESSVGDECIKGVTQMKAWLKSRGVKISGNKPELIDRMLLADPNVEIFDKLVDDHNNMHEGKEEVDHGLFTSIGAMRSKFDSFNSRHNVLGDGAIIEGSVIVEHESGITLKARPDIITSDGVVINYKTCVSANPNVFMKKALNLGYVLRAAFEFDMSESLLGRAPSGYSIVAQEKEAPYSIVKYDFGPRELEIGREMYMEALHKYIDYKQTGEVSGYPEEIQFALPDYMYED